MTYEKTTRRCRTFRTIWESEETDYHFPWNSETAGKTVRDRSGKHSVEGVDIIIVRGEFKQKLRETGARQDTAGKALIYATVGESQRRPQVTSGRQCQWKLFGNDEKVLPRLQRD